MDITKAYTYLTEDSRWTTKLGIGAGIVLSAVIIPILPFLVLLGYELDITRRVAENKSPLPEWEDFGRYFMDGLYITVARLVYASPMLLLFCLGFGIMIVPAMLGTSEDVMVAIGGTGMIVMTCLSLLLGLVLAFLTPAINIQYVRTNDFASLFRIGEVLQIAKNNMSDMIMIVLAIMGATLIMSIVTSLSAITVCGPFIMIFVGPAWMRMVSGHLNGQLLAKISGKEMAYN